jgi:hypothetical protein
MPWFNTTTSQSRSEFTTASGGTIGGGTLTGRTIDTSVAITVDRMATPNIGKPNKEQVTTTPKNLGAIFSTFNQEEDTHEVQERGEVLYLSSQDDDDRIIMSQEEERLYSQEKE